MTTAPTTATSGGADLDEHTPLSPRSPQYLYRVYDESRALLYVGVTGNIEGRMKEHKRRSWWREVDLVTSEAYGSRSAVLDAERCAIETEGPRYNRQLVDPRLWILDAATGADDHRTAAESLDLIAELVEIERDVQRRIDAAIRAALALPGVTQPQVADRLGITARGLRKRLATRQETS